MRRENYSSLRWLGFGLILLTSLAAPASASAARDASPQSPALAPAVLTQWGLIRGVERGATYAYLGVPFAAPPLGALRWKAPSDPAPWQGELLTQAYPPKCPQTDGSGLPIGNEDCLYLNVWTPKTAIPGGALPVMVFMHGGGNASGSTSDGDGANYLYDGELLSQLGQTVIVTLQYRLGALGFLVHPGLMNENPDLMVGNYGLLDQIKALKWVKDNISQFGGDPNEVLLFGESAGALDTCMLLVSPQAAGLFRRALMESGGCIAKSLVERIVEGLDFTAAVGCGSDPDQTACLRSLPASTLVTAIDTTSIVNGIVRMFFGATIDGVLLPMDPMNALLQGQFNKMPFAIGANADEMLISVDQNLTLAQYNAAVHAFIDPFGTSYANQALTFYPVGNNPGMYSTPHKAFAALTTDAQFVCPSRRIARAVDGSQTQSVYRYFFTQSLGFPINLDPNYNGAFHGLELAYVFQRMQFIPNYFPSSGDLALQAAMGGYWSRFAASGDPNVAGSVLWPEYISATDPYIELKSNIVAGQGVRTAKCNFWDTLPIYRIHLPLSLKP